MHLLCPHCRNPIEVVKLSSREEITCPSCGSGFFLESESTTGLESGAQQTVGRFEVLDVLGRGGFGTVYKARDPELDRVVAIKVPRAGNLAGPHDLDRFLREARSVAQLRHPAIVSVHEVGLNNGLPYLVSDFVPGVTLADLLDRRRPAADEAARLLAEVAEALQYAHEQGIIHRDVKPSNIMLDAENRPHLMDFGLAKRDAGEITMTIEGQVLGTPAYMSPEQARGEGHTVDGRSDVYSLGVVLYQVSTGELPFRGTKRMLLHQVLHDEPRPPRRLNDAIPRDLETICLKAMAKEPGRRYATAGALAADLHRFLKREPIEARPVGRLERGWRWCRRSPALAAALAGVLLVFAAGATVSTVLAIRESDAHGKADEARGRAEHEADNARTEKIAAVAARNELQVANDRLLTSAARSLLRAFPALPNWRATGLNDPEIEALWEVAETSDEMLRLRFVEDAIRNPVSTRQLRSRAGWAMQATVGLDARRRGAVERVLTARLSDTDLALDHRIDLALTLAALGDLKPQPAREAATLLTEAMARSNDAFRLGAQARGLATVVARLEPREAAALCAPAAARLTQIMTTNADELKELAQALVVMSARLEPRAAVTTLTGAMTRTKDANVLRDLAPALVSVAERLGPGEDAAECSQIAALLVETMARTRDDYLHTQLTMVLVAVVKRLDLKDAAKLLLRAMDDTNDPFSLWGLARGLAGVTGRMERKESAVVCAPAAARLLQRMRQDLWPDSQGLLAEGLAEVAARLEAKEEAIVCAEGVGLLTRAMNVPSPAEGGRWLPQGLAVLLARLGPKEAAGLLLRAIDAKTKASALEVLAQRLAAVAVRLGPDERTAVCAQAATVLTQALAATTAPAALSSLATGLAALAPWLEPKQAGAVCAQAASALTRALTPVVANSRDSWPLWRLTQGLVAVAPWLERKDAAEVAAFLAHTMSQASDPSLLPRLAGALAAVALQLEPSEAEAVASRAAALLTKAMASKPATSFSGTFLEDGLVHVAARLKPKDASVLLMQAMANTTNPLALGKLAVGLAAVATRLEPHDAAKALTQAMAEITDGHALVPLAHGVAAVAARLEPQEAAAVCSRAAKLLTQARSRSTYPYGSEQLAQALAAVAAWLGPEEAGVVCARASTLVIHTMARTTDSFQFSRLAQALVPALTRVPNDHCRERSTSLTAAIGLAVAPGSWPAAVAHLSPAQEPLPEPLPPQVLVDVLKHPLCIGEARRIVLEQLGNRYRRTFADQWELVRYAEEQKLGLDFTTPPRRPVIDR
jgi:hypothetical protein